MMRDLFNEAKKDVWSQFFFLGIITILGIIGYKMIQGKDSFSLFGNNPSRSRYQAPQNSSSTHSSFASKSTGNTPHVKHTSKLRPSVTGTGVSNILKQKNSGYWLLDDSLASDADSNSLREIINNAKDGDHIKVRPGTYSLDNVKFNKPLSFEGIDGDRKEIIFARKNIYFKSDKAKSLSFKNITFLNSSDGYGKIFYFYNTKLNIENCNFAVDGKSTAIEAKGKSEITIKNSTFAKINQDNDRGVGVDIENGKVQIFNTKIAFFQNGIYASDSEVLIQDSELVNNRYAVKLDSNNKLTIYNSLFGYSKNALYVNKSNNSIHVDDGKFIECDTFISSTNTNKFKLKKSKFIKSPGHGLYISSYTDLEIIDSEFKEIHKSAISGWSHHYNLVLYNNDFIKVNNAISIGGGSLNSKNNKYEEVRQRLKLKRGATVSGKFEGQKILESID